MNLLNYLKSEFVSFDVYRKSPSIDSDGVQTFTTARIGNGSGDLQAVSSELRAGEAGKDILGTHVLYTTGDIQVDDEIHVTSEVYRVISVLDLKDYLEVHLEIRS